MNVDAVPGVPEITPGDDIARIAAERTSLRPDDVLVVASTVVSKATGRTASLADFPPGSRANEIAARLSDIADEPKDPRFAQAVLAESTALVMTAPFLLTETRFGHIAVNAGIDRSNAGDADLLLLPERPGERAASIRSGLATELGLDGGGADGRSTTAQADGPPAVIVSDTCGRPFRCGQTGVAIGWAGLPPTRDWRGETDRDGREMHATVQAVVDELAAAANLVAGEGDGGTPIVRIRGWAFGDHDGGDGLFRDSDTDFVRQALRGWSYDPDAEADRTTAPAGASPAEGTGSSDPTGFTAPMTSYEPPDDPAGDAAAPPDGVDNGGSDPE